jgi:glycosyltransferase involved in cell wall biosynthesis
MTTALKALCADDTLRQRLGAAGRKRALEFYVWDKLGDRLQEIYTEFLIACDLE